MRLNIKMRYKMSAVLETLILILFITGALVVSSITGLFIDSEFVPDIFESVKITDEDNSTASNVTVSPVDRKRYLEELQSETTKTMIATLVYLVLLAVLGVVGNTLVILVYTRRLHWSATQVLLMALSGFDLVANVIAIPGEIYNILHKWDLNHPALCKARLFCSAFTTITSAMILVVVAIVRYRKVCRPFKWQITADQAKVISVVISVFGALFAAPHAILNGRQKRGTPRRNIIALGCGTDDNFEHTELPLLNYLFLTMLYIVCSVILTVLYILIGITACKHRRLAPSPLVSATPTPSSRQGCDALELASNRNESNCTRCREAFNMRIDTSITVETSIQSARNVDDIKMKPFHVANGTNEAPVQYNAHVFTDQIKVRTPTAAVFSIIAHKTKPGNTTSRASHPDNTDMSTHSTLKGNGSGEDTRISVIRMIGSSNSNIKMRTVKSNLGDFVSNVKYTESYIDEFPTGVNKFYLAKIKDTSVNTVHSKVISVITGLINDKKVRNLNVADNNRHPPQLTETAADEILNEYDPWSMFKCLQVIYCAHDEHTTFNSNCVQKETGLSVRLPLNNDLLQKTEWVRASVIEAMEKTDAMSTENPRDNFPGVGATVDINRAGTSSPERFPDSSTTGMALSDQNENALGLQMIESMKGIPLFTIVGNSEYSMPVSRTTTIVFIITALYIVSYLPHLALMIIKFVSPETITNLSLTLCIFYNLFVRSFFLNSAVNPIIYSMRDDNFRRECIQICKITKR